MYSKKNLLSIVLIFLLFSLAVVVTTSSTFNSPALVVQKNHEMEIQQLKIQVLKFNLGVNLYNQSKNNLPLLRSEFLKTRLAYKKAETFIEYFNREFAQKFFNGAPLPKMMQGVDWIEVQEPEGLQVLDEIIFSDSIDSDLLREKSSSLIKNISDFSTNYKFKFEDRNVFEASRIALIRIFTLGLTGFDAPVSGNSLEEAYTSFSSVHSAIQPYFSLIKSKNKLLADSLNFLFKDGLKYLKENRDFDSFDRLFFLKKYVNPLYGCLLNGQLLLGIETWYETSSAKKSINYYSNSIFSANFLNKYYYLQYPDKKYTKEVVDLGKFIFFDPILSNNNKRSCASCHNPNKAFTDGADKSMAMDFDGKVLRNSPSLVNAIYSDRYFLDLRVDKLEDQIEHVVVSEKEFHTDYFNIFDKLLTSKEYVKMFKNSFPESKGNPINTYTLSTSLAAYVSSLTALSSPFDRYVRDETKEINQGVVKGFNLFMGKAGCGTCHFAPTFNGSTPPFYTESESEVLGVPKSKDKNSPLDDDAGRYSGKVRENSTIYLHSFKTPTVRNVSLTAPYMHNGVYNTLEEVMDFYNNGGGAGVGLNVPNQTLPSDSLHLTSSEINDIVSFMKSLTDTSGTTSIPTRLPFFNDDKLNTRKIGGEY